MSSHAATIEATIAESFAGPSPGELLRRRVRGHAGLLIGAGVLVLIALMAFAAPWLAPHDPFAQDLARRLIPPIWHEAGNWSHPLGTDMLGRDYLSRVIYGSRISLLIGFSVMVLSGVIGAVLGIVAGYFGGRTDLVVTYLITVRLSLPVILVALTTVALVGSSLW
ncbi:MAG: ABC transporter permease, partial [Betaproteobacteria bacterium]|nr:ABC transporter permease [Betaproteobacteria bacterium]